MRLLGIFCISIGFTGIGLLWAIPAFGQATQNDSFVVKQEVVGDTQAPTVPTVITASAVSTTQIDVAWSTSTDDVEVAGYRLFRDGVQIATTQQTTYTDTGLTPDTAYVYAVQAYDTSLNISSSSATTSARTFAPSTTRTAQMVRLTDIYIEPDSTSAVFTWTSNVYTRYVLRWGKTADYELGSVRGEVYKKTHKTEVAGLEPNTTYFYELRAYNRYNRSFLLSRSTFVTDTVLDTQAPANVTNLQAIAQGNAVLLEWGNPDDTDFAKVRIVRSYLFYPEDPLDGFVVYEGGAERFLDTRAFAQGEDAYYTVFTYDTSGNVSSGAVVFISATGDTPQTPEAEGATTTPDALLQDRDEDERIMLLDFSDVIFMQDGSVLPNEGQRVVLESDKPFLVQLPAALLPRHLKTITVTLRDASGEEYSYLLRSNVEKTKYEAFLQGVPEGVYPVSFLVYDYKTQLRTSFGGTLLARSPISQAVVYEVGRPESARVGSTLLLLSIGGVWLFLLLWGYLRVRRRRTEDN